MATPGVEIDGFVYVTLTEENVDEAIEVAGEAMGTREPVISALGLPKGDTNLFSRMKPLLLGGLSTIAKDAATGRVVGCRFTTDWVDTPGPPPFPSELEAFSAMWREHDEAWAKSKGEIKRGEWAHWTGVTVHHEYTGRGISNHLYRINCELLKSKGYIGALCENASFFSAKAAEAAGAVQVSVQEYATWEYPPGSGKFPLACVQPPHQHFQLREKTF